MPADAALLDTSVVIDSEQVAEGLPSTIAISSLTLAELAAGPHAATDPAERARRQQRLQWAEATFRPIPFDARAARAYGGIVADVLAAGRQTRRRAVDLLLAAVARSRRPRPATRNPDDFNGLDLDLLPL